MTLPDLVCISSFVSQSHMSDMLQPTLCLMFFNCSLPRECSYLSGVALEMLPIVHLRCICGQISSHLHEWVIHPTLCSKWQLHINCLINPLTQLPLPTVLLKCPSGYEWLHLPSLVKLYYNAHQGWMPWNLIGWVTSKDNPYSITNNRQIRNCRKIMIVISSFLKYCLSFLPHPPLSASLSLPLKAMIYTGPIQTADSMVQMVQQSLVILAENRFHNHNFNHETDWGQKHNCRYTVGDSSYSN